MCLAPMIALLAVVTLHPNQYHTSDMDGMQIEGQTCVTGLGAYANMSSTRMYAGGIQYGVNLWQKDSFSIISQIYVGASYTDRWVPELPNGVQFNTGLRLLGKWRDTIFEVAYEHNSNGGLGREVQRDGYIYGNTGLDLLKFGVGIEF